MRESKVIELKLSKDNSEFLPRFFENFKAFRELFNELVCWGNDSVLIRKDGEVTETDLVSKRKELYESYTDKSISFEDFEKCLKFLYTELINSTQARGMVSSIFGNVRNIDDIDVLTDFSILEQDESSGNSQMWYSVSSTLKKIGFMNRYPFRDDLSSPEKFISLFNILGTFKSWRTWDAERKISYETEEQEILERYNLIDESVREDLKNFFEYCISENILKTFTWRAKSYMNDCLIPVLREGKTECPKGFSLNQKGNKCRYSLDEKFFEYLKKNPKLWNSEKPIVVEHWGILELIMIHRKHSPRACFPVVGKTDYHRFKYALGANFDSYEFSCKNGISLEDLSMEIDKEASSDYICGFETERPCISFGEKGKHKFEIFITKMQDGKKHPNPYFKTFKYWTQKKKSKSDKNTTLIKFKRKGDNEFYGLIKEPSLVYKNSDLYIRLNFTVVSKVGADMKELSNHESLAYLMASSLPICPTKKTKLSEIGKNSERIKEFSGKSFNMMGIDLGMANPYAYSIAKVTINGTPKSVEKNSVKFLDLGVYPSESNSEYREFLEDLKTFGVVVGMTKSFCLHPEDDLDFSSENRIQKLISNAKKFFDSHSVLRGADKSCLYAKQVETVLKNYISKKNFDFGLMKTDKGFLIKVLFRYLRTRFNQIRDDRKMSFKSVGYKTTDGSEFTWIECIEKMKRCCRSLSYLGLDNTRTPIETKLLNDYFNNCKENLLKTVCSSIAEIANNNKCAIVFVEKLDSQNSMKSKKENFLTSLWSPKMFQGQLQNALSWYGIYIVEVNENCTSQRECDSKKFGYRKGRTFYWEEKDTIYEIDADINAAKNILMNGATRHYDLYQVNVSNFENKKIGKRSQGAMTASFGTVSVAEEFFKTRYDSLDKEHSSPYFYLHGKKWISQCERKEIENHIKEVMEL